MVSVYRVCGELNKEDRLMTDEDKRKDHTAFVAYCPFGVN